MTTANWGAVCGQFVTTERVPVRIFRSIYRRAERSHDTAMQLNGRPLNIEVPQANRRSGLLMANRLLQARTPDGSLISVRIPVTRENRRLLRKLRAAELVAWRAMERVGMGSEHRGS